MDEFGNVIDNSGADAYYLPADQAGANLTLPYSTNPGDTSFSTTTARSTPASPTTITDTLTGAATSITGLATSIFKASASIDALQINRDIAKANAAAQIAQAQSATQLAQANATGALNRAKVAAAYPLGVPLAATPNGKLIIGAALVGVVLFAMSMQKGK